MATFTIAGNLGGLNVPVTTEIPRPPGAGLAPWAGEIPPYRLSQVARKPFAQMTGKLGKALVHLPAHALMTMFPDCLGVVP